MTTFALLTNSFIASNAAILTSAYNFANGVNTYAYSAYATANSAQANTVITQGVDAQQNAWISANAIYAAAAYGFANTVNTYAYSAYATANSAQANTITTQGVDAQQNTWISSNSVYAAAAYGFANTVNTYAYSAYAVANSANAIYSSGGTINASLTVARDLTVQGNLSILGNSTTIYTSSIDVYDSLIYLANNNFTMQAPSATASLVGVDTTHAVTIAGAAAGSHTVIIKDANGCSISKNITIFKIFTLELNLFNTSNNNQFSKFGFEL